MGLPGSGKSTYAAELSNISKRTMDRSLFIDCDMYMFDPAYSFLNMKSIDAVLRRYLAVTSNFNVICIDGLITTNEQVQTVINLCHLKMNVYSKPDEFRIIIDHWDEDRETCLHNDKFRREHSSETTIRNMQLDNPDGYQFDSEIPVEVVHHTVKKKTMYEAVLLPKSSNNRPGKLVSERWTTGGNWKDCWGGESIIHPEGAKDFIELDELLGQICPNITFLQYKKLEKSCVSIEYDYENDYYGGRQNYAMWVCDLKSLYETLSEMNLITDDLMYAGC